MSGPTDQQVWIASEAAQIEARAWRIMDFKGRGAVAIRDRLENPLNANGAVAEAGSTFERHDFSDRAAAERYIEWRAVRAALIAYEGTRP